MEHRYGKLQEIFIISGIFAFALLLRLIGLRWGLPDAQHWYSYHPDEFQIFRSVANLDFFSGQFNPHFFNYPSLFIYLTYLAHTLLAGFGVFQLNASDPAIVWQWPQQILLTARVLNALFGAGTAILVYGTLRAWQPKMSIAYAILGGILMAVVPGHVQHSHFATVDVAATFFIIFTMFLTVRTLQLEDSTTSFLGSCFVAGLAAATKYNAGLIIVAPLCVLLVDENLRARVKVLLPALIGLALAGFVVGCPYSMLNFQEFWGDGQNAGVAYELLVHPRQGQGDVFAATGNGWWYHLTFNLPFVLTWPLLLLALGGVIALWRDESKARWSILCFMSLYFVSLGFSQVRFMRYVLPLAPLLIVAASLGARQIKVLWGLRTKVLLCGTISIIALWGSVNVLANFVQIDPRSQATEYIKTHAGNAATIGMIDVPRFWSPPLVPQDVVFGSNLTLGDIEKTNPVQEFQFVITGFDGTKLLQEKPRWFVMSEFEWRDEARLHPEKFRQFTEMLKKEYQLQEIDKNRPWLPLPGRSFVPHDFLYTNPEIQVYRRKG